MNGPEPGLRELKKQMTRDSIASAALQLTLQKGLGDVTVEEIAREAFVSPRTVSNYFASKEEAIVAAAIPDWASVADRFAASPLTGRPLAALCVMFSEFVQTLPPEQVASLGQTCELVNQFPALRPHETAAYDDLESALRQCLAARAGIDPAQHMYPWLVAAAAVSAIRSALRLWAASDGQVEALVHHIQDAFNQISDGLPSPVKPPEDESARPSG